MKQSKPKADFYQTDEDIVRLVQQFEACTLHRSGWNHAAHLTIAVWYLSICSKTEAIARIRTGIQHYNQCNGIMTTSSSGYHETLTLFWIAIACRFLAVTNHNASISALINDFISTYGEQKTLFYEYYSHELIMSWEARQSWVAPDLKPFDDISSH
ncbi:hypothetical protein [Nostoc sp. 106C]|uniref:hypothetical protein n=1 Tax=Nostoc sp. 106C TaxID=1932667 RepID=UPI000A35F109|nr:hypothetical protein [Nostoc sp. 106C]OUL20687.1 hypothetical protein BV375_30550 [Nostoc sp. 106C]